MHYKRYSVYNINEVFVSGKIFLDRLLSIHYDMIIIVQYCSHSLDY